MIGRVPKFCTRSALGTGKSRVVDTLMRVSIVFFVYCAFQVEAMKSVSPGRFYGTSKRTVPVDQTESEIDTDNEEDQDYQPPNAESTNANSVSAESATSSENGDDGTDVEASTKPKGVSEIINSL